MAERTRGKPPPGGLRVESPMFLHEPTLPRRARDARLASAVPFAFALSSACSGTDVGYPFCGTGTGGFVTSDATGGSGDVAALGGNGAVTASGGSASMSPGGAGGTGGTRATGGSGATSATGGTSGAGGAGKGGSGGASNAGSGASGGDGNTGGGGGTSAAGNGAGGTTTEAFSWPNPYDAGTMPSPADGHHNPGASCMLSSCHGTKVPFVFGGTVYRADGTTVAPNVEVGISDGTVTLTAYSAANGNIWLPADAGSIDWTRAVIALRNANGEVQKPADAPRDTSCNASGCHASTNRMLEP